MEITRNNWRQYIQNLAKADDKAAEMVTSYLQSHEIASEAGFQAFVDFYYAVVTKYAEGASEMAAQAYEALAEAQGATIKSAMPAETPSREECAKTIRGTMLDSDQVKSLAQTAGRLVRRTGVDTTINNALRDGAEWAWVPSGDTCAFCMMLASNGWQKASKKALKNGHASHIHANCDCTYAIRFDGKSTVEGYDPDYYKALYDNAEGTRWQDKLNSMRRDKYAANRDRINARKRELYAIQKPGIKMLKLAKQGNIFTSKMDDLSEYAKKIKPIDGFEDIVVHGDRYGLAFRDADGNESDVSVREFADILEKGGIYKGGKIRLIACQVGAGDGTVPTYLAKRFNTEVLAPSEAVFVDSEGNMILADEEINAKMGIETGQWIPYGPEGRIK